MGGIYHVLNRGNGDQEVLHQEKDYQALIELFFPTPIMDHLA